VSLGDEESATCTVKVDEPAVVGVPESVPPLLRLRPAGKLPEATLQEYGVKPPVAARDAEYPVPAVPLGSEAVVIETGRTSAKTVIVNDWTALNLGEDESSTLAAKVDEPTVVGVPEMVPVALRLSPAGNEPEFTVQEYGGTPPVAVNVVE